MQVINPANGDVIVDLPTDDKKSIQKKFGTLEGMGGSWADRSLDDRIATIAEFTHLFDTNKKEIAETLTQEMGKPIHESYNEVRGCIDRCQYFIDHGREYLQTKVMRRFGNMEERLSFDPLGKIAYISAWNFPHHIAGNVIPAALIGGNSILFKPSEYTPQSGLLWERLLYAAGVPREAFQTVIGGGEVGAAMLELPLDGVFFTGSHTTGAHIANTVGHKMIPVGMELGGKDPAYVREDVADIAAVAAALVEGSFYNNGQSCCGVERIYVHADVYEKFVDHFVKAAAELTVGDPMNKKTTQGPLTRKAQVDFLLQQVTDATSKGATIALGGERSSRGEYYFPPTVLTNVNHTMSVMRDESFGPIIGIAKVSGDPEALELMQDTDYGLTASIYTQNINRGTELLNTLDTGTGYINCCDRISPYLPWSGRKNSGVGSTLSPLGIHTFVQPKALHIAH